MRHIAFGSFDKIGNKVIASFELYLDICPCFFRTSDQFYKVVIDADKPKSNKGKNTVDATMPRRAPAVVDVEGALRVLELTGTPTLDDVRRQYRALAHRYHPKTRSNVAEEVNAARVVLDALTDALELLEEHLLPA